jgi:hypothetical protein
MNDEGAEYLCITRIEIGTKCIVERLLCLSSGLYYTQIQTLETHNLVSQQSTNEFFVWHNRLGYPGSTMMHRILENSIGHSLKNQKIFQSSEFTCAACSVGKFITQPSIVKVGTESPVFLERIQGDIYGLIDPSSGPFRYFMVLIDASTR